MKVIITATGVMDRYQLTWPESWPIPRVGDDVDIPALPEVQQVRTVVWNPEGDYEDKTPFVYIVVGPRRPDFG